MRRPEVALPVELSSHTLITIATTAEPTYRLRLCFSRFLLNNDDGTLPHKKRRSRGPSPIYTRGEANKIVDSLTHPLIKKNKAFRIFDELAHVAIEKDLRESLIKFIRYSLPGIVRELMLEDEEGDESSE